MPTIERSTSNELTPKETQISKMVSCGMRNREIAEAMAISEQDVKNRLRHIFNKVGCWSRTELAIRILNRGQQLSLKIK